MTSTPLHQIPGRKHQAPARGHRWARSARARPPSSMTWQDHARALGSGRWSPTTSTPRRTPSSSCAGALAPERIIGVETGGCPHTAIREDASINLEAGRPPERRFPRLDIVFVESGGDNLAATFSPELSDLTIYVIDVAAGDKIPRKGGPGITRSDLLVINKIDGNRPFLFSNQKTGRGLREIIDFIERRGMLAAA